MTTQKITSSQAARRTGAVNSRWDRVLAATDATSLRARTIARNMLSRPPLNAAAPRTGVVQTSRGVHSVIKAFN